jgi:formiminoglutamate deiminase
VSAYWLERAYVDGRTVDGVRVEIADGRFAAVETGVDAAGANRLAGLTIPGLANCHSHAFHRALRGRTQRERGTFWTWREQMYGVAARLTPDTYYALARATYREMVVGGITCVGEFHYLHHGPDGTPYDDANAMGHAVLAAAAEAGLRITLLDSCYLAAGLGKEPEGVQRRFSDGDAESWAARADALRRGDGSRVGAAVHSVRAVPREQVPTVAQWATRHDTPLHVHLSEQVAENEECLAAHGVTPTELLAEAGALDRRTSAVHATHLTDTDVALLGGSGTHACFCPTTERDLGDGLPDVGALVTSGARLAVGIDSHVVTQPLEDLRGIELGERLRTGKRVVLPPVPGMTPAEVLWRIASVETAAACGFEGAGGEVAVDRAHPDLALVSDSRLLDAVVYGAGSDVVSRAW